MATISSQGIGSGLDVKSIVSQLVALEKQPLEKLQLQAATVQTKISVFGQIKSLVSSLQDAVGKLTSLTGWNGVSATSSDSSFVTVSAIGGTQPTSFDVEVLGLAKAQSTYSAALLPVGDPVGAGTLQLEIGEWSGGTFTPGGGWTDWRITCGAVVHLSPQWHLVAGGRWPQLDRCLAKHSIVSERGTRSSSIFGVGAGYVWG